MDLDLYQAETARIADQQVALLTAARQILASGRSLSALEQSGVLHALQVLIENAIGKAKQWLKAAQHAVPVSAYDTFNALAVRGLIAQEDLSTWNALIGLRNKIVHDYMNIDMGRVIALVKAEQERFIVGFLLKPFEITPAFKNFQHKD